MAEKKHTVAKKLVHAGGWQIAKRVAKSIPPFGTVLAIGLVGLDIKNKGLVKGVVNSGIDAIPFVGLAKNAVEIFTGDFIPDKDRSKLRKPSVKTEISAKN
jgi:hypothetical protein